MPTKNPRVNIVLERPLYETLSRLARLRAAHASYALATGEMERVGPGAWVRRRYALKTAN